ncbi:MAG: glutathione S-transferase [Burkholderiales bacterium]
MNGDAGDGRFRAARAPRSKSGTMHPDPAGNRLPILYSFRRCPYAIRARLALKGSGIRVALREVRLRDKPAALAAASPKATVPVLQLPDGSVLEQSLDIMRWALRAHDPQGWLRADEQPDTQVLIDLNDGAFKRALDRYKYASGTAQSDRDEAVALMLAPLNTRLAAHRFLLRDTPSLADIAIVPFVRQFAAVDDVWFDDAPLPHLRSWLRGLSASTLFDSVMLKQAAWRPGDADTVF